MSFEVLSSEYFVSSEDFYVSDRNILIPGRFHTKTYGISKSRKETPQKLTQLSSRSHPRHLVGKKTAQKDITIDITSDSQVNSNFPNRWSPASLTFYNYFYLFLYLYLTKFVNETFKLQTYYTQKCKHFA